MADALPSFLDFRRMFTMLEAKAGQWGSNTMGTICSSSFFDFDFDEENNGLRDDEWWSVVPRGWAFFF